MRRLVITFFLVSLVLLSQSYYYNDYFGRRMGPTDTLLVTLYDNQNKRYVFVAVQDFWPLVTEHLRSAK